MPAAPLPWSQPAGTCVADLLERLARVQNSPVPCRSVLFVTQHYTLCGTEFSHAACCVAVWLAETLTAQARALLQDGGSAQGQKEEKKEDTKGSDKKEGKTEDKKVEEKKDGGNVPVWGPSDTKADQGKGGNASQDKKDEKANSANTPVWGPADTYEKIKGRGGC